MRNQTYTEEAQYCRRLATDFEESAEKPFLLRIADAFEDLHEQSVRGSGRAIRPLGELLTLERLPPVTTHRWTPRRKAEVVAAVLGGLLSVDEACQRYSLTAEEFTSWQDALDRNGMRGLRVTHLQDYRNSFDREPS